MTRPHRQLLELAEAPRRLADVLDRDPDVSLGAKIVADLKTIGGVLCLKRGYAQTFRARA